jgi:anti-anti-sigma factor
MTPFTTTYTVSGGHCVLTVYGEVDLSTAPQLHAAALDALRDHGALVIDLEATTFFDASGLRVLLHLKHAAPSTVIVNPNRYLLRLMDLTSTREPLLEGNEDVIDLSAAETCGAGGAR